MDVENSVEAPKTSRRQIKKGGVKTMPFIIVNEALEKVASYGLTANMILYLIGSYHMGVAKATNILFFWSAATNFFPLAGAFLSDSYLGRFLSIGLGSLFSLLGMVILWLTAMIPQAKPPPCDPRKGNCQSPTSVQYLVLLSSLALMSIGAGGIRPCSLAFGADQLDKRGSSGKKNERVLEKFFTWYYASVAVSVVIAFSGIVYIQDHFGWKIGFGVPAIIMFLSAISFFLASPFYIKMKVTSCLLTSFMQVAVASWRNRKLDFTSQGENGGFGYHHKKDSKLTKPTNKLRFLNKACIIQNPGDITAVGAAANPWRLCTVEQVEELKALLRVAPLWSTSIMMSVNVSQSSFPLLQANSMDRHVTSGFKISAGSFGMFTIGGAIIWIVLYDRVIIPLASKIRGKPVRVGLKEKMGMGLFCSFLAMVVAAIVEHVRRRKAIDSGYLNNPAGVVAMSALWLIPQNFLNGMAEAFNAVSQNQFFYLELPKSMSSIASCLTGLSLAVGNLLASLILNIVDDITKKEGKESWLADNINKGHYESYYWLLAILSSINLFYFLLCSWAYGPCAEDGLFQRKDLKEEEMSIIGNGGEGTKEDRV